MDQPPAGAARPSDGVGVFAASEAALLRMAASSSIRFLTSGGGSLLPVPTWLSPPESQPTKQKGMVAKHIASKSLVRIVLPQIWVSRKLDLVVHSVATSRHGGAFGYYNWSRGLLSSESGEPTL
jgi:hypothetical protein